MVDYRTFNFPGFSQGSNLLTGIRQDDKDLYITGFYVPEDSGTVSYLYKGSWSNIKQGSGGYYILNYPGSNTTNLYGPKVLKHNKVRVVGNYTLTGSSNLYGCMYSGSLNGDGCWKTIMPRDAINAICHSTDGKLVVGNYDTATVTGNAFIYDIVSDKFKDIKHKKAKSITAYGIVYLGCDEYVICGGYSPIGLGAPTDVGYTVHYNRKTKKFSKWRDYYYDEQLNCSTGEGRCPSPNQSKSDVTHFDGISKHNNDYGYNLTGVALYESKEVAFVAHVNKHGHVTWSNIAYPNAITTTGNSIANKFVIGVYTDQSGVVNSYIAKLTH